MHQVLQSTLKKMQLRWKERNVSREWIHASGCLGEIKLRMLYPRKQKYPS